VLTPLGGSSGKRRVHRVSRVLDPGAVLLGSNLSIEVDNHVVEIADHRPEQGDPLLHPASLDLLPAKQTHLAIVLHALSQTRIPSPPNPRRERPRKLATGCLVAPLPPPSTHRAERRSEVGRDRSQDRSGSRRTALQSVA